jgi:AcrR family transcriptional regulator
VTEVPWWPVRRRDRATAEPVSAEMVVRASLDLLRSGGIEALSMRKVAAELGVSVSTVYWWAGNKEQLLALVADEVHRGIELPPDAPTASWVEQLRTYAEHTYAVYREHAFVLPIITAGVLTGPHTLDVVECGLAILTRAGFSRADAVAAQSALAALILGFLPPTPGGAAREEAWTHGHRLDEADAHRYPTVVAAAAELHDPDHDARFRFALAVFLAGLAAPASAPHRA